MNRIWDPNGKYSGAVLKEYNHWVIEVSFRQHTPGSFIIFAKREIERISQLNSEEAKELIKVMSQIETALSRSPVFKPDRFNYLQLGNELHHLHFHGIPRYKKPRTFYNKDWVDNAWGHPPIFSNTEVSRDLALAVKDEILKYLQK